MTELALLIHGDSRGRPPDLIVVGTQECKYHVEKGKGMATKKQKETSQTIN